MSQHPRPIVPHPLGEHASPAGASDSASMAALGASSSARSGQGGASSGTAAGGEMSQLDSFELAMVLSHYDLGRIAAIRQFNRGSHKSPKLLIQTDTGTFLLKRRARGKDDPFKVAFSHSLQLHLASKQFPLPRLIGTKGDNRSMLQMQNAVYEVFEYIRGGGYDNSLEATASAGKTLALYHKILADYQPEYEPPVGSYHASRIVSKSMESLPTMLQRVDPQNVADQADKVASVIRYLRSSYNEAALRVNEMGLIDWPMQIVHGDWHPGNMLFRGSRVVAVIDYDTARIQQRIIDVANGTLQFCILGGGDDPAQWPSNIDAARFKRFLRGYDSVPGGVITKAELATLPWLMLEALIAESVIPIAATGSFARLDGLGFLLMIERKARWLQEHAAELIRIADE